MKKKLLVVGGSYADVPLVKAAQRLGYYVITTGNNAQGAAHALSDLYVPADFSDNEAILNVAREQRVEAICPCTNDFSALSAAYAAQQLRLPGFDAFATMEILHLKDRFREFCASHQIPAPKALGASTMSQALSALERLRFPLLIKPVDLTGGKGISLVQDRKQADHAIRTALDMSHAKRLVLEERLDGSRHAMSAFIRGGKVVFQFIDNEHYYLNPYLVSGASTPTLVSVQSVQKLISHIERIARILTLKDGIFHVQFIMEKDQPMIIEVCRRAPGDLYIHLVELATGVDYSEWIVKASAGLDCSDVSQHDVRGYFLRHCLMVDRSGRYRGFTIDPSIEHKIIERIIWAKEGDPVENHLVFKPGIAFLKFQSQADMIKESDKMQELIRVNVY